MDGPRERQLHRRAAPEAARRDRATSVGTSAGGRGDRPRRRSPTPACRSPACGSSTAPGSRSLDRLTARALVGAAARRLGRPRRAALVLAALPVAGMSGTLEDRMRAPPARGNVQREDRHDDPGLGALRLRRRPLRLLGAPERQPGLVVLGAPGAGPLRDGASRASSFLQRGLVEHAARRLLGLREPSSPGSRRRPRRSSSSRRESETFAPSASSAARASSRLKPSSVPVITYVRAGQRALDRPLLLAGLEAQAELRAAPRRARGSRRRRTTRRSPRRARARCPRTSTISSCVAAASRSTRAEVAREVLRRHPADVRDVEPEAARARTGSRFDASIAVDRVRRARSRAKPSSSSSCSFVSR